MTVDFTNSKQDDEHISMPATASAVTARRSSSDSSPIPSTAVRPNTRRNTSGSREARDAMLRLEPQVSLFFYSLFTDYFYL